MADDLEAIVQRMIDAGEDEESIASVIREYAPPKAASTSPAQKPVTPGVMAGVGALASAPAVISGINTAANLASKMPYKRAVPLVAGVGAVSDLSQGNYKGAAVKGATAVAPAVVKAAQKATSPLEGVLPSGARWMAKPGVGTLTRGANWLSRFAGAAALPAMIVSSLYDNFQYGQAQAAKLDDPNLSDLEKQIILRDLHTAGGF